MVGSLIRRRVRLVSTDRKHTSLEPGDEGTVVGVDDESGALSVRWDRVSRQLLFPKFDRWEWLGTPPPTIRFPDEVILKALLRIRHRDRELADIDGAAGTGESWREHDDEVAESLRGRRIRLVSTNDPYTDLQPGDEGWVRSVSCSNGTVWVRWDRRIGPSEMLPGIDRWDWL